MGPLEYGLLIAVIDGFRHWWLAPAALVLSYVSIRIEMWMDKQDEKP